eukprot:3047998-Prymnesium_polylepis.1
MVDGQAVKRANLYTMDEGESSVWDRELGSGGGADHSAPARAAPVPAAKKRKPTMPRPAPVLTAEQE